MMTCKRKILHDETIFNMKTKERFLFFNDSHIALHTINNSKVYRYCLDILLIEIYLNSIASYY